MFVLSSYQLQSLARADRERFLVRAAEVLDRLHQAVVGSEAPPAASEIAERTAFFESLGYAEETHLLILLAVFTVFRGFATRRELGPAVKEVVTDARHESSEKIHGLVLMLQSDLQNAILKCTPWPAY